MIDANVACRELVTYKPSNVVIMCKVSIPIDVNKFPEKERLMSRNLFHFLFAVLFIAVGIGTFCLVDSTRAAELISRPIDGGEVVGYKDTPILPWTEGKWHVHDPDRPYPAIVTPGQSSDSRPPSDAIVLFDGNDLSKWQPSNWEVKDGSVVAGQGSLLSKDAFGDCQLHIEWMAPNAPSKQMMSRGNSGVILMTKYEIQIFDSHASNQTQIYPDGQAASIYGQTPPLVNACRKPGQWQSYDIFFTSPVFDDGKLVSPGKVTMLHNGVLVHLNQPIMGPMAHRVILPYEAHEAKLPLLLQGHGSPVQFRNIWIREL